MTNRVLFLITRALDGLGDAVRTPSGVNVDLLRAYGRSDLAGLPNYFGSECTSPTDRR